MSSLGAGPLLDASSRVREEFMEHRPAWSGRRRGNATGAIAVGAAAIGPTAIGALAIGAFAVGAFVARRVLIRRLVVERASFGELAVQDLSVGRLRVTELVVESSLALPEGSGLETSSSLRRPGTRASDKG
jgi:hypothetical protein